MKISIGNLVEMLQKFPENCAVEVYSGYRETEVGFHLAYDDEDGIVYIHVED